MPLVRPGKPPAEDDEEVSGVFPVVIPGNAPLDTCPDDSGADAGASAGKHKVHADT